SLPAATAPCVPRTACRTNGSCGFGEIVTRRCALPVPTRIRAAVTTAKVNFIRRILPYTDHSPVEEQKEFNNLISADAAGHTPSATPGDEEPMLFCPVCSERLDSRKCKLFCRRCGYYMSCADYI